LTALLHQGSTVDIRAVLLGDWTPGANAAIDPDGRATIDQRAIRVATLDPSTAAQLLQVVREAEPEPQDPVSPSNQPSTNSEACRAAIEAAMERTGAEQGGDATAATDGDVGDRVMIRMLGRVAVLDKAGHPTPGLRQHAGGLLAYLVVHRPGADKNDIMEALWPDASVRRAAERLSTEVGNLRRCIRQAAQNQDVQPVVNTGGRYHLNPDVVDVDVWRLHDALRQATTATDPAQRVQALQAGVSIYTGSMADRHDYHWLEPVREQLRRNVIRAHLHLADLVSAENPRHAADLTAAAARLDLASEELAQLAMEASSRIGHTGAVAAQLRQLRSALRDIDEEPSSETLTLAAQLQTHDPRRSDPLPSPTRQSS
jgi:DNA-binding SARP family transcriptional activator